MNLCQPLLTEAVGGRTGWQAGRILVIGEKVTGGAERAAGGGALTRASRRSSVAWRIEEWLLL